MKAIYEAYEPPCLHPSPYVTLFHLCTPPLHLFLCPCTVTHKNPVFPETIQFFLQYQGLVNVQLMYLNPVEDTSFKRIDPKWDTLDNWFFGARDYAVIGHKI